MTRFAQLVMGPAGSGKSTYCSNMVKHCEVLGRTVHVVNLDPAAEQFDYPVLADVRELIHIDDAMEDEALQFGPNGGLIFCMEYLVQNLDWLREQLDDVEDDYIIFDCPGQIELYTHIPAMKQLVETLQNWNFRVCGVFLIDSQFMIEASKFTSGVLTALSTMVNMEITHVNILTKLDLLSKKAKKDLDRYLDPDMETLLQEEFMDEKFSHRFKKLNQAVAKLVDDYSLVKFLPLDITDEESINDILLQIDLAIQYGDELEPREPRDPEDLDPTEENVDSGYDQGE
ncbi:GPN-loop GTPase 3-like [Haliotis cracherodii]|uniref:GPN-loop GTPase 3-like n=1 Tax=Haliotis cracherodii TaxID=6455 RepID=UPI0039EB4587